MLYSLLLLAHAEQSLVFVGNSYTQYNALPTQVETTLETSMRGWETVNVTSLTSGGMTLANHATRMNDEGSSWQQAFSREQDWFVFQDQSQIPGFPESEVYWQNSLAGLQEMHDQVAAMGGQSMLMLTWGRRDGDVQNPVLYEDFSMMQERLNEGYISYASQAGSVANPIYVAPVGPVFAYVHDNYNEEFYSLYDNDGSHPSQLGSKIASLSIASSLTGRSVDVSTVDISSEDMAWSLEAIHNTVLESAVGIYPMPWVWSVIPDNGEIRDEVVRPLLRIRADQDVDLNIVDGRVWIENGRMLGDITIQEGSELRIDGGSQVGIVDGNLELRSGRLRLTEVTGDVLQTGGEIWLDAEQVTIGGLATLTFLELHPDLEESVLSTGDMDVSNLQVGDGLDWTETLDNSIYVVRMPSAQDTGEPSTEPETEDAVSEKDSTGCAGMGLVFFMPLWFCRRRRISQE